MVQLQLMYFTYTVRDHNSGDLIWTTCNTTITITGSNNNAPVASDNDTGYIIEDQTLTVRMVATAVTGSDSNNNNESGDNTGDV